MGRGKRYSIEDYADRVFLYIQTQELEVSTEEVMENVPGTRHRVIEGLFYLGMTKRVKIQVKKNNLYWIPNTSI